MENNSFTRLVFVQADPPSLADNTADLDRLRRAVARVLPQAPVPDRILSPSIRWDRVASLAASFRKAGFQGYALVHEMPNGCYELAGFSPSRPAVLTAMAVDIGTTHLEASLVNLETGRKLAESRCLNPQIACGEDVLSRYHFARTAKNGPHILQQHVVSAINSLAADLSRAAGLHGPREILSAAVAGNTAMTHFFLGLPAEHLCREPYIPVAHHVEPPDASPLGLNLHPAAAVLVFPGVGSYFGGDLIAGIVATGMASQKQPSMLIDVGTNAEVVMGNRDWLIACAGAAGPALEGGVTSMGMRAAPGAIEHVKIDRLTGILSISTIDNAPACGICGSGMIELMAELYLAGVIDMRGQFRTKGMAPSLARRLVQREGNTCFAVAAKEETATGNEVVLSQVDLDALMRSKAAMYAILTTLKNQVDIAFSDLETIHVAGAFGRHISPRHATVLGMLPDIDPALFEPVGNTSLKGAIMALVSQEARQEMIALPGKITYMELNVNQEFMMRFSGAKVIPHTDRSLFPSVPVVDEKNGCPAPVVPDN